MNLLQELTMRPIEPGMSQRLSDVSAMNNPFADNEDNTPFNRGPFDSMSDDSTDDDMDPQEGETDRLVQSFLSWLTDNKDLISSQSVGMEDEELGNEMQITQKTQMDDLSNNSQGMDPNMSNDPSVPEDPNKQGTIRKVEGAHLIYKRRMDTGLFDELWAYNIEAGDNQYEIRSVLLNGTDIDPDETSSEDGTQSYELWSVGNAQFVLITGLSN